MNDDTKKELEQTQVVSSNVNSEVNNENVSTNINETGVVAEVSFDYPENEVVEEKKEETKEEANTVVDAPIAVSSTATLEEVSAGSESSLEVIEVSSDSVFNKKEDETTTGAMKEGQERINEKKGFPYGMVIIFVLLIICAFFIDNIVGFVEDVVMNKDDALIEEKKKDDELDLKNETSKDENNQNTGQ